MDCFDALRFMLIFLSEIYTEANLEALSDNLIICTWGSMVCRSVYTYLEARSIFVPHGPGLASACFK
jgi:hypothetical protein